VCALTVERVQTHPVGGEGRSSTGRLLRMRNLFVIVVMKVDDERNTLQKKSAKPKVLPLKRIDKRER
jgi:hypothetical protein